MNKPNTTPQNMPEPSFFQRIPLAFGAFFSILSDAGFAARIRDLPLGAAQPQPQAQPAVQEMPKAVAPRPLRETPTDAALQLLGLLQRDARLIDFAEENLSRLFRCRHRRRRPPGARRLPQGAARAFHHRAGASGGRRQPHHLERGLRCERDPAHRQCGRPAAIQRQPQPPRLARHRSPAAETGRQP